MKGKLQSKAKKVMKEPRTKSRTPVPKKKRSTVGKVIAGAVIAGATALVAKKLKSKKATAKREKTNVKPATQGATIKKAGGFDLNQKDLAHSPGHRKINLQNEFSHKSGIKTEPQNASAQNNMARDNRIKRTNSSHRRIITGAALGKTGRITIKES
jgi:hypothetical protein